jgi:hypothetical protein
MQEIASLKLIHDMPFWNLLGRDGGDSLMLCGIERLAGCLNWNDVKSRQGSRQLLECEIHALDEDIAASSISRGRDGPFEIIDDRQEFLQQLFIAESDLVALVPLTQSLIVIELGGEAEIFIAQALHLISLCRKSLLKLLDLAVFLCSRGDIFG